MANFRANQEKIAEAWKSGMAGNPFAKMAETNLAMMRAATTAFTGQGAPTSTSGRTAEGKSDDTAQELASMRDQMAAMQKKLDELGK